MVIFSYQKLTSDFAVLILDILSDQVCLRNNGFFQMFDFRKNI